MASGAGVQALVAGSVDTSQILGLTLRAAINRGAPLKIVMVFNDQPTYRLMAKKEIASFADLKGKSSPAVLRSISGYVAAAPFGKTRRRSAQGCHDRLYREFQCHLSIPNRWSVAAAVLVPPLDAVAKEADFRELADFAKEDLGPFIGGGVSVSDKFLRERPDCFCDFYARPGKRTG